MPWYPRVEAALPTNPTEAPQWADLTPWVESFTYRRGRRFPLEPAQSGAATLRLDNRDRRFDPRHASGPYYGWLKPMRRIRIQWASIEGGGGDGYAALVRADAPAGYWRLGEASGTVAEDSSDANRDGTYHGPPALGEAGAIAGDSDTAIELTNP